MHHNIRCNNGGLVIAHHNKICDDVIHLDRRDLSPHQVRSEPLINQVRRRSEGEVRHRRSIKKTWDDVLIRGLWESHTDSIIDIRFGDDDVETYKKEGMDTLFPRRKHTKK